MNAEIKAIFLDVGNTLRIVIEDVDFRKKQFSNSLILLELRVTPIHFAIF